VLFPEVGELAANRQPDNLVAMQELAAHVQGVEVVDHLQRLHADGPGRAQHDDAANVGPHRLLPRAVGGLARRELAAAGVKKAPRRARLCRRSGFGSRLGRALAARLRRLLAVSAILSRLCIGLGVPTALVLLPAAAVATAAPAPATPTTTLAAITSGLLAAARSGLGLAAGFGRLVIPVVLRRRDRGVHRRGRGLAQRLHL
jgi:hypothetical protein